MFAVHKFLYNIMYMYKPYSQHPGLNEKALKLLEDRVRTYKTAFPFWAGPITPHVTLCHPDTLRAVVSNLDHADKPTKGPYDFVKPWIGNLHHY
jgi:hypothetical protein